MAERRWRPDWDHPFGSGLVVLAPEADDVVDPIRRRYDPYAGIGVPSHVTALYPFAEPASITPDVHDVIRETVASVPAFAFELTHVAAFEDAVYLAPTPPEPFVHLTAALAAAFPAHPPYGGAFDGVVPHLTLGWTDEGATLQELEATLGGSLPIRSTAVEVTLLLEDEQGWAIGRSFPLGVGAGGRR